MPSQTQRNIKALAAIVLLAGAPFCVADAATDRSTTHRTPPDPTACTAGADYVGGVDVDGHRVAPADLDGTAPPLHGTQVQLRLRHNLRIKVRVPPPDNCAGR